jgi:hypothetical protein
MGKRIEVTYALVFEFKRIRVLREQPVDGISSFAAPPSVKTVLSTVGNVIIEPVSDLQFQLRAWLLSFTEMDYTTETN